MLRASPRVLREPVGLTRLPEISFGYFLAVAEPTLWLCNLFASFGSYSLSNRMAERGHTCVSEGVATRGPKWVDADIGLAWLDARFRSLICR